ncbi:hypothetical protein LguiB_017192 [Lonicera macranthoides]
MITCLANYQLTAVYDVKFDNDHVLTTVTSSGTDVDQRINEIMRKHQDRLHKLVIGIDTKWCLNKTKSIANLQLCVGHRCLIFQLLHADEIPASLYKFLNDTNFTFVAVEIQNDEYEEMGLKTMAQGVLGKEMKKPYDITVSKWDVVCLSDDQVEYACLDAFVSFEIGMKLL